MSIRVNIAVNYASQIYVALAGIVALPIYLKYMGAEAYGLIGFFAMLQAWFGLLDLGLTPTIGRETSRYQGGAISALAYRQIYRMLSLLFVLIAITGGSGLWLASDAIATRWLNPEQMAYEEVVISVQIMAFCVALRWMGGLYRGIITGTEKLVWLGSINVLMASLRFIIVLPVMGYFGFTAYVFFVYQLSIAVFELIVFWFKANTLLPGKKALNHPVGWSFVPVKASLQFALTVTTASIVWTLTTQTDKLLLSGMLSLENYGYFALATLVAGGILTIATPISNVVMPRMTILNAQNQPEAMIHFYLKATQLVSLVTGSIAISIACCAEHLLYAWTGDRQLTTEAAPILRLYATGNCLLAIAAFSYYLQYAKGTLRYHVIGCLAMAVIMLPAIGLAAHYSGGKGAGYVWLITNALYVLLWVSYVHKKLVPGLNKLWIYRGVIKCTLPGVIIATLVYNAPIPVETRTENALYTATVFIMVTLANFLSMSVKSRK